MQQPDPSQGFFVVLNAADSDLDGLGNGYEAWFDYNGAHTALDSPDSESPVDNLLDGWEVAYGLNPTSTGGPDDVADGNPDGDLDPFDDTTPLTNFKEFERYAAFFGSYDPLKVYNTAENRPVVWILPESQSPVCEEATFTISRFGGGVQDITQPLFVHYSVGGTLRFGTDYTLDPAPNTEPGDTEHPDGYPRIFLAKIPAFMQFVIVRATLQGHPVTSGEKTLEIALTPYSVSPKTQDPNPLNGKYVVDLPQSRDRARATFNVENLRPFASGQSVQACRNIPRQIALSGFDNCGSPLTFAIVDPPGPRIIDRL